MKTLILISGLVIASCSALAQKSAGQLLPETRADQNKRVDITITVNGSTIRITGHVKFNILTSTLTFEGSITVTGNGESIVMPVNYDGPLQKGPNRYSYNKGRLSEEELATVDWVLSRLYFDKPRKTRFDQSILSN